MTAHEQYQERREEIEKEIELLKERLKAMDTKESNYPENWGYSGNCGHILEVLKNLNQFCKY